MATMVNVRLSSVCSALRAAAFRGDDGTAEDPQALGELIEAMARAGLRTVAYEDLPETVQLALDRHLPE